MRCSTGRREDEAGDGIAVGQQGLNQGLEIGEVGGGHLEQEVVAAGEVVALADLFEGLDVFEQAVVVLAPATHADEGEHFEAEGFAVDFEGVAARMPVSSICLRRSPVAVGERPMRRPSSARLRRALA